MELHKQLKISLLSVIFLLSVNILVSQNDQPTTAINGEYYLLEAERGVANKFTKTKFFEFGKYNGTELLAIAACKKCMSAVYTYKKEESKEIGVPVFYNNMGFYVITYDENSFIMVMLSSQEDWTSFSYSNFYSKDKSKVSGMSKLKIKEYMIKLSN